MNVEKIKKILSEKQYLSSKDIMELVGCSAYEARRLRKECLETYMPSVCGTKVMVRVDRFLEYYKNQFITDIYKSLIIQNS